ncbi:carboxymuconolactone decarboxylase [Polaribacter sp. ALD11]|uniref:carboxymuconolactone decarboxylase family protein n=1 Tax=Polaribacter sp. ALD11 TaxID=2058137 RepID=UPI000C3157A7|nr:carboxymuconolactone decarboxylase family protein [Polaribacter sp. ALD11]AUC85408.1 carboxymuconolactone decarboxylase [Polaribacter sp. ALD11]
MERISYQEVPTEIFEKLRAIEDYLHSSTLGMPLLELLRLRVAQINGCAYCVDMHYKELKHANETELRMASLCLWKETSYFSDKERAVLQLAEKLTKLNSEPITESIYKSLFEFFSKSEVCNLALAIAQINTWTRLMITFQFTPGNYKVSR